jgi:DNA-binding PadR family transcriptional regulator
MWCSSDLAGTAQNASIRAAKASQPIVASVNTDRSAALRLLPGGLPAEVLRVLCASRPAALNQDIKALAGVELGPGTLYGALDRLERLGLIEPLPAEDRRHPYRITAPGAAALRVHLDSLERVSAAGRLRLRLGGI